MTGCYADPPVGSVWQEITLWRKGERARRVSLGVILTPVGSVRQEITLWRKGERARRVSLGVILTPGWFCPAGDHTVEEG